MSTKKNFKYKKNAKFKKSKRKIYIKRHSTRKIEDKEEEEEEEEEKEKEDEILPYIRTV